MVGGEETGTGTEAGTGTSVGTAVDTVGGCLVCGDDGDVRRHTLTVGDATHTVPLCADHHEFVRRDRPDRNGESFAAAETRKVTARIPTTLLEDVDERASELEVPRSELIRDCLRDGLYAADTDVSPEDFLVAVVETRRRLEQLQSRLAARNGEHDGTRDGPSGTGEGRRNGEHAGSDPDASAGGADDDAATSHVGSRGRDPDVEFLKERIVRLESLLELALE